MTRNLANRTSGWRRSPIISRKNLDLFLQFRVCGRDASHEAVAS